MRSRCLMVACLLASAAAAEEAVTVLNGFETAEGIDRFCGRVRNAYLRPSPEPRREGQGSCRIDFLMDFGTGRPGAVTGYYSRGDFPYGNWAPYQAVLCEALNPGDAPLPLHLVVTDAAGKSSDHAVALPPGRWATVRVTIAELKARRLDVARIERITVAVQPSEVTRPVAVYLDHLRLAGADAKAIAAARAVEDKTAASRKRAYPPRMPTARLVPKLHPRPSRTIRQVRQVPVTYETEVIVVGGGLAGVAAAVAAAREGADVLLIERFGALGGMATSGLVPPALNVTLTRGLALEFDQRLLQRGGSAERRSVEVMKQVLLEMVQEAGAKLLLYTLATDAIVEAETIRGVICETKAGPQAFLGRIVIDCTGDGDIAARAGAPFELGRGRDAETQCMTLVFLLGNADTQKIRVGRDDYRKLVRKARGAGDLTIPYGGGAAIQTVVAGPHGVVNVNSVNIPLVHGLKVEDLTYAHVECHREIIEFVGFFRKYVPGCEGAYVLSTATSIGVRESRRILGEYVLTGSDVLAGRRFPDAVTRGFYPIDIHTADSTGDGGGARLRRSYDIPYRCLVPRKIENLLVAGRCISADHIAHGSLRVMGTTLPLGEAAGTAAALCVREKVAPRRLDPKKLLAALKRRNAQPAEELLVPDNYALRTNGAKVEADSFLSERARTAIGAIDGVVTKTQASRWLSDRGPGPHWLVVDLGQPRAISRVRLYLYDPPAAAGRYLLCDYAIQVEGPDGQWRPVAEAKDNREPRPVHRFEQVTTRRVRLYITRAARADSIARLREIEIH